MAMIYVAGGARVSTTSSFAQEFGRQLRLGGVDRGGRVDGPGNPLVWS